MTGRHLRLLLIEDSVDDAEFIARTLRRAGYTLDVVRVESDGALREALDDDQFDLVITDHELRSFDSTEVLETLRAMAPHLPCLLVSGKVGEEAVGQAMRHGAADYVAKDNLARLPTAIELMLAESDQVRERQLSQEALARSGRLFEAVFLNAGDVMLIFDDQRRVIDANPAAAEILQTSREDLMRLRAEDIMPEAARVGVPWFWSRFLASENQRGELELLTAGGTAVATEYTVGANFLPDRHILVMRDIRERRAGEAEVRRRVAQQESIVALGERALREPRLDLLMEEAVACVAATLDVEIASVLELRAGEDAFKVAAEVGLGPLPAGARIPHGAPTSSQASFTVRQKQMVVVDDYDDETRFAQAPTLSDWGVRSALTVPIPGKPNPFGVLETASRTRRAFDVGDGSFLTAVANLLADALERSRSEEETRQRALHDPLTGLANRTLLFDRLTLALAHAKRSGTRVAVLFLDIDHFKQFNDTFGHRAGDQLLCEVGARVEGVLREGDTAARFGGDEFIVVFDNLAGEAEAETVTARVHAVLGAPFSFDGEPRRMSMSIGVAMSDEEHLDGESLLRDADAALYRSKERGRGRWTLATAETRAAPDGVDPAHALERAIAGGELVLHYQPIVSFDGGLCGVEALVRWQDPDRGLILPEDFIAFAEQSALILRLGEWVLRAACAQAARWREEFGDRAPLPIHVNVSARQLAQADLPETVREIVEAAGVPPHDIVLEITESGLDQASGVPIAAVGDLRGMGFRVALDDFGTGFSSLSSLEPFRIDTLKIDRTVVQPLGWPATSAPTVTAIVGMAGALAIGTIAEGVETAAQAAAVAALGCDRAQGYYFARPAPAEEVARLVRDGTPLRRRAAQALALIPPRLRPTHRRMPGAGGRAGDPASVATYRASFFEALLAADIDAADEVVDAALRDHVPPAMVDARIIGPAMIEFGRLWELGEASVAQQHLASEIAGQAARRVAGASAHLRGDRPAPLTGQTVLLANVEGDEHDLGLQMAADTLRSLGAEVLHLGERIADDHLRDAAAQLQPDIIGFSLTLPELGQRLEQQVEALRDECPDALVLLGGQGVTSALITRTQATFVESVEQLADMMSRRQRVLPEHAGA